MLLLHPLYLLPKKKKWGPKILGALICSTVCTPPKPGLGGNVMFMQDFMKTRDIQVGVDVSTMIEEGRWNFGIVGGTKWSFQQRMVQHHVWKWL
jgi:hypothetical protein